MLTPQPKETSPNGRKTGNNHHYWFFCKKQKCDNEDSANTDTESMGNKSESENENAEEIKSSPENVSINSLWKLLWLI